MSKFKFSYAQQAGSWFQSALIQVVETLSGRAHIERLYSNLQQTPHSDNSSFWTKAVKQLEFDIQLTGRDLINTPKQGPLIVISNHPYGILDGITLSYLIEKVRPDFKILASSVLAQVPELSEHLLAVDLSSRKEAREHNLAMRRKALEHLNNGGSLIIFPAGLISVSQDRWGKNLALDPPWGTFTSKLIKRSQANVLPVFFHGQNGRLFQIVSHISRTLKLALIFHEVKARIGSKVEVTIGDVMPYKESALLSNKDLTQFLRRTTYALKAEKP